VDRRLEAIVVEFQIAAPAIKILRIVVLRAVVVAGRRRQVFAIVAFLDLLASKILAQEAQRLFAEDALRLLIRFHSAKVTRQWLYYTT